MKYLQDIRYELEFQLELFVCLTNASHAATQVCSNDINDYFPPDLELLHGPWPFFWHLHTQHQYQSSSFQWAVNHLQKSTYS